MRAVAFLTTVLLAVAVPLRAQSLADVARKEQERREQIKEPAKVYTNKDLQPAPPPSSAPAGDAADAAAKGDKAAAPDAKPADGTDRAQSADGAGKAKGPAKDQAYWSKRLKDLQTNLDRDQTYAAALESRINALWTDFVNRDDPVQRSGIEQDRNKALAELDRLKKQIVDDKKAIDDLEEEARKAGVPAGWLRS